MNQLTYTLSIGYQPQQQICTLLLQWSQGQQEVLTALYPQASINQYNAWTVAYKQHYRIHSNPNQRQGGSIPFIPSGDAYRDVKTAERELLHAFKQWLTNSGAQAIENELRSALDQLSSSDQSSTRNRARTTAKNQVDGIDIYLDYDLNTLPREIQILPWERWITGLANDDLSKRLRLLRSPRKTAIALKSGSSRRFVSQLRRSPKTRILAVLADDPSVRTEDYWQQLSRLRAIAHVERASWNPEGDRAQIIHSIFQKITDDQGWDMLFFAGHSEYDGHSGTFRLTQNVTIAMDELSETLETAKQHGLRVAIFNSCSGFRLGDACVSQGIQALVMRELLPQTLAIRFLDFFTEALLNPASSNGHDVYTAMLTACDQVERQDSTLGLPSGQLLPCFFSPAHQAPFHIQPMGWRLALKQWMPRPWQEVATGAIVLASFMIPVQDLLIDLRHLSQAIYRDITQQGIDMESTPKVHIIAINQDSVTDARENQIHSASWSKMVDRQYLGAIISELARRNVQTIGINYLLHTREANQEKLDQAIQAAVEQQQTQFIFGVDSIEKLWVHPDTINPSHHLEGDMIFYQWFVNRPVNGHCQSVCPLGYLTALIYYLTQSCPEDQNIEPLTIPNLEYDDASDEQKNTTFQDRITTYTKNHEEGLINTSFIRPNLLGDNQRYLIDFSLPPTQVYQRTASVDLFHQGLEQTNINEQLVLIGERGVMESYESGRLPLPSAVYYWRWRQTRNSNSLIATYQQFPPVLSGVEVHAYMAHHFLEDHLVTVIPEIWILGIAALMGKATVIFLLNQSASKKQKWTLILIIGITGIISLQLYISAKIFISWLLPSSIFTIYTLPVFRRNIDEV